MESILEMWSWFHMLAKPFGGIILLCRSHVLNELTGTNLSFKERNIFEGSGGDDLNRLGLTVLNVKGAPENI